MSSELMKRIEATFVKYSLKPYLCPPFSDYMENQLIKVLEKQKEKGDKCEIGGSILENRDGLELRIIKPHSLELQENALDEFIRGEYVNAPLLSEHLDQIAETYKTHFPENKMSIQLFECLEEEIQNAVNGKYTEATRKEVAEDYQVFVLGTSYVADLRELLTNSRDFRGTFHVHHDGSKPSLVDINNNKILSIPTLVVSATAKYEEEGLKLYLIHGGTVELLYQGLLQPDKK
jgi:hypothetical protein